MNGFLKSDVLKYFMASDSEVVRSSAREPKLKTYISVIAPNKVEAEVLEAKTSTESEKRLK